MRIPDRPLGLSEQGAWIRTRWGNWIVVSTRPNLLAIGRIKASDFSPTYTVRLSLKPGGPPRVVVLDPPLELPAGRSAIPHMYDQQRLCLFYPPGREWTASKRVADTIIPWISEWLGFYEIWLVTDEWLGGGIHPS